MIVFDTPDQITVPGKSMITIGKFDGIHRAHRLLMKDIIAKAVAENAQAVAISVDIAPQGILSEQEKEDVLDHLGIDYLIRLPFTADVIRMPPDRFAEEILSKKLHASSVTVGEDFRFGYQRAGDAQRLRALGEQFGFSVTVLPDLYQGNRKVSSSWVREAILEGRMEDAARLLDAPYAITGEVVHGLALGRTIGVPTANVIPPKDKLLPRYGVYCTESIVGGQRLFGITNIGMKPTVGASFPCAETFFFDFTGEVYGAVEKTALLHFLREERKFDSVQALAEALQKDISDGRRYFQERLDG